MDFRSGSVVAMPAHDDQLFASRGSLSALQLLHQSQAGRSINKVETETLPGLSNLGNTCFMNAMLQCLLNTPGRLTEACKAFADLTPGRGLSSSGMVGKCFAELLADYDSRTSGSIPAWRGPLRRMKVAIAALHPSYKGIRQQDAYEFLCHLLDGLEENFRFLLQAHGARECESNGMGIVRSVCGVSTYTTRFCHGCSQEFHVDRVTDTALRLPLLSAACQSDKTLRESEESTPITLEHLIVSSQYHEEVDGYRCDNCDAIALGNGTTGVPSAASQTSGLISATSEILVLVLNRFLNVTKDDGTFASVKVRRQVAVPSVLTMPFGTYRLYGIVSHIGESTSRGHYVAAVRSLRDHQWYH
jgi:ubiquitin C-terminal hydrolase